MISQADFEKNLSQFTGTENWYKNPLFPKMSYTDGAKYVADELGAYWLLDDISVYQTDKKVCKEEFQVWKLRVSDSEGILTCEDGNYKKVFSKKISFTDFPFPEIELWCVNNVILLRSEY